MIFLLFKSCLLPSCRAESKCYSHATGSKTRLHCYPGFLWDSRTSIGHFLSSTWWLGPTHASLWRTLTCSQDTINKLLCTCNLSWQTKVSVVRMWEMSELNILKAASRSGIDIPRFFVASEWKFRNKSHTLAILWLLLHKTCRTLFHDCMNYMIDVDAKLSKVLSDAI